MDIDNNNDKNNLEIEGEPLEVTTSLSSLTEKSKKNYEITYNQFMAWRSEKRIDSFSEGVMLAYFAELANKHKSSTLWTYYSMLRSTLSIRHNVKIEDYKKLRFFLKRKVENYQPRRTEILTREEINRFITEAPDVKYLATKVALIMGMMGPCRSTELYEMQIDDVEDVKTKFLVTIPKTKRIFTITDDYYEICKNYVHLRPLNVPTNAFFLNYQNGKCTVKRIGLHKLSAMAREVAMYLQLPNPEGFTGHCFRKSGDFTHLKQRAFVENNCVSFGHSQSSFEPQGSVNNEIKIEVSNDDPISTETVNVEEEIFEQESPPIKRKDKLVIRNEQSSLQREDVADLFGKFVALQLQKIDNQDLHHDTMLEIHRILHKSILDNNR